MRPRSRLLAKRRLHLPTITEGYEDLVRDMNHANSLNSARPHALSEEDYLLSICQLARPAFSSLDSSSSCDIINTRLQDPLRQRAGLPRPAVHHRTTSDLNKDSLGKYVCDVTTARQGERQSLNGKVQTTGCHGASDPLEYLYGHQNNPAPSTCQSGSLRQRLADGRARPTVNPAPAPSAAMVPSPAPPYSETPGATSVKQSLVSKWICDCRSAWREAQHQACMLPSIAEM